MCIISCLWCISLSRSAWVTSLEIFFVSPIFPRLPLPMILSVLLSSSLSPTFVAQHCHRFLYFTTNKLWLFTKWQFGYAQRESGARIISPINPIAESPGTVFSGHSQLSVTITNKLLSTKGDSVRVARRATDSFSELLKDSPCSFWVSSTSTWRLVFPTSSSFACQAPSKRRAGSTWRRGFLVHPPSSFSS